MPAQLIMSTHLTMIAAADELSSESANATPGIVFSNLPIGIYRATSTGRIVAANKTLLQMFDSNSLKELNDTFEAPGFHLVCQRKEFQEQLKTVGVIRAFESRSSLHDGRRFHSRENVNVVRGDSGEVVFYEGTIEALDESPRTVEGTDLLNALMESSPDTIYFKDNSSRFIRINKAQAELLGLNSPEDAIGKSDFDFFTHEHAREAFEDERRIIESRKLVVDKVERIRGGDGTYHWVSATKVPMMNERGEVIGLAGISRDITERKNAELEKQVLFRIMDGISQTEKLSDLLELIHESISEVVCAENCYVALIDEITGLLHFEFYVDKVDEAPLPRPATGGLTGYLLKKNCPLLLTDRQQRQMMARGEVQVAGTVSAAWLGVPLRTPAGTIGALVVQSYDDSAAFTPRDLEFLTSVGSQIAITIERQRAQDRLGRTAAMLSQSNRELQDFASVASHDLQEPLRKIQAFGDRLRQKCEGQLSEAGIDYLGRMLNAASRMQTLINDLLTFSRVTTKAQPFSKVDLNVIARDVLSDLEVRIEQTGGSVEVTDLPVIDADPLQMRQLFQNLIANALKFRKPDQPAVVKIFADCNSQIAEGATWAFANNENWQISVADNGIGFDEKYLDRIFTVFQRLHGRNTYEGTGVGLAVCRRIVERHNGSITARSKPGQGATFIVKLPSTQQKGTNE
ncbi:MAG TPA: ATP-binding protein [Pyrinomonadaceae bacterium]|jgi:PAS domain S-box-containing protein